MSFSDPYQAYVEGSMYSGNPLGLVIALYEGTIESIAQAKSCLASGDIPGRTRAINKAIKLSTELLISLDHKEGGEISANLKRLYSYVQCRILEAHAKQASAPLDEANALLTNMLEGWRGAAEKMNAEASTAAARPDRTEHAAPAWGYDLVPEFTGAGTLSATF